MTDKPTDSQIDRQKVKKSTLSVLFKTYFFLFLNVIVYNEKEQRPNKYRCFYK